MPGNPNSVALGHYLPIQRMSNVKAVDIGESVALVLKENGSLWGFGSSLYGLLGNEDSTSVVPASEAIHLMDDVVSMAVGDTHAAAIKRDGTLWTWGSNAGGQLGLGTVDSDKHSAPTKVMENAKAVAIGGPSLSTVGAYTAAIQNDGSLWTWGCSTYGITSGTTNNESPNKKMDDVVKVAAGSQHILVKKTDGSIWGFGRRMEGQLGNGEFPYDDLGQTTPVQIMLSTVTPPEENEPVITIEESKLSTVISSNGISSKDKAALETVLSNADVVGLKDALNDSDIKQIIQSSGVDISGDTAVKVQLQTELTVTAADLDKGTISFEVAPTAEVTAGSENKTVSVDNSYLNGKSITVKLPIPSGFTPKEILHISKGKPVEQYLLNSDFTVEDGTAVLYIDHFSELRMNESQTTVAKIEGSDTGYFSLQSAIDAAGSDAKINLYNNSDDTVLKVANKSLTINCNTYKLRSDVDWQLTNCTKSETTDDQNNPVIVITYTGGGSSSGGGGGSSSSSNKPTALVSGSGGKVTVASDGTVTITPDAGYQIAKITVNGKEVDIPANGKLTGLDKDDKVVVTFEKIPEEKPDESTTPFTDVAENAWYADAVQYVYEKGIMNGTSATSFSPNETTTRGMIVTMLHRLEDTPSAISSGFTDVSAGAWYADAVAWAAANGVVNGISDSSFAPETAITREQLATILYRYAQLKGYDVSVSGDLSGYADASQISEYAITAMQWANENDLITGNTATTLNPQGNATRAEVATILMRFIENMG